MQGLKDLKAFQILLPLALLYACGQSSDPKETYKEPPLPAYFDSVAANDEPVSLPGKIKSLKQFLLSKPAQPTPTKRIIYIRPIGTFTALQQQQVKLLRTYLQAFYQLPARVLEPLPSDTIPSSARRYTGNDQLLAGYILDSLLKGTVPDDGIQLLGVSELDLYPKPEWMYVFGLASYTHRVAVSSIYRFQGYELTDTNFASCLHRFLKVSSHEVGHAFGLQHCVQARCVMNFSNNLPELDRTAARLCSNCQRKIYTSLKYDIGKRNRELADFFQRMHWEEELVLIQKDQRVSVSH